MDKQTRELPYFFAKAHGVLVEHRDADIVVYCRNVPSPIIFAELTRRLLAPYRIEIIAAETFSIKLRAQYENLAEMALKDDNAMSRQLSLNSLADAIPQTQDVLDQRHDAPVIKFINAIFSHAIRQNASDIHIEPAETGVVVRYRLDGVLHTITEVRQELNVMISSRVKVMANLDIAEKRIPQDGRISLEQGNHSIDVRVSTMPTRHGERIVLRLLNKGQVGLDFDQLGMSHNDKRKLQLSVLTKPHGIVLVTGPTGSGKTTSLYACLKHLNDGHRNILTIEDPVEYDLPGIGQSQINPKVDMTFANGLRAILRQDPDIVMVGEIRDLETARIAIQASLTGHLVMSTLHTNTAIGAITRLIDMGVEPFLLSSSLVALMAQRLVRRICPHCRTSATPSPGDAQLMRLHGIHVDELFFGTGCSICMETGYKGRLSIYELVVVDTTLRELIHNGASEIDVAAYARKQSPSILNDGLDKVAAGLTTISEILRVTDANSEPAHAAR